MTSHETRREYLLEVIRRAEVELAELDSDDRPRVTCSCGCGATKPDDGRCECGRPLGHD